MADTIVFEFENAHGHSPKHVGPQLQCTAYGPSKGLKPVSKLLKVLHTINPLLLIKQFINTLTRSTHRK